MDGHVVRLVKGDPKNKVVYSDDPVAVARWWAKEGADELHLVDLDATLTRGNNHNIIMEIAGSTDIPVQVAGGIRSKELAQQVLAKTKRVVLGTLAYRDPESVAQLVKDFGSNRIVIAIDQINGVVMIDGWRRESGMKVMDAIRNHLHKNLNTFLMTSVERDGTLSGPDLELLGEVCKLKDVHVIASGGISSNEDVAEVRKLGAYGVILGKALYDGRIDIKKAKESVE